LVICLIGLLGRGAGAEEVGLGLELGGVPVGLWGLGPDPLRERAGLPGLAGPDALGPVGVRCVTEALAETAQGCPARLVAGFGAAAPLERITGSELAAGLWLAATGARPLGPANTCPSEPRPPKPPVSPSRASATNTATGSAKAAADAAVS
jgi:hypothetical protein